jgi:predicted secreted protein
MEEIQANISPDTVFLVENKGSKFSVGLVANSGTGYQWKQKLADPNIVKFLGEKTIPLGTPKPGSPVEFRFDYEAMKNGNVLVEFDLIGPDKKIAKTDKFDFVVT